MANVINLPCRITFSNNRRIETLYRADSRSSCGRNTFVTGLNGRVKIHYNTKSNKITDLTEIILDQKNVPISGNNLTTTYFRGQKINPAHIPGIKSMLILQSKPIGKINSPVLLPLK